MNRAVAHRTLTARSTLPSKKQTANRCCWRKHHTDVVTLGTVGRSKRKATDRMQLMEMSKFSRTQSLMIFQLMPRQ
eukprot:scaffold37917_cov17-Prasinocladus_malaysianus.AAC.2